MQTVNLTETRQSLSPEVTLQRRIAQHMLAEPVISEPDALDIVRGVLGNESLGTEELARLFADVADELRQFHYGIQRTFLPGDRDGIGQYFWVLFNSGPDDYTRLSPFSALELEFLRCMFEHMASSDTQCIRSLDAMNLRINREGQAVPYSAHDREAFLARLVSEHWLQQRECGYAVGIRAVVELAAYLGEEDRFGQCQMCHCPAAFATTPCPNGSCRRRVHGHCLDRAVAGSLNPTCSSCDTRLS